MNRDERQQLRATADEISTWVDLATPIRAQRRELADLSIAGRTELLAKVVDVPHGGQLAWRVLPLRNPDRDRLEHIARYEALPRISSEFREALKEMTSTIPTALQDLRALTGTGRFFRMGIGREKGHSAAASLTTFREGFLRNGMLDTLKRLSTEKVTLPGKPALTQALDEFVGLSPRLASLGASATIVVAETFSRLKDSVATIQGAADEENRCRAAALDAGNEVRQTETARMVADMAVDRLKEATRDKISTRPLSDAGLSTVAAVLAHPGLQILPGIGEKSAARILGAARTLWQTTYEEMPARIDIKKRTPEATKLLRCLRSWDALRKNIGGTTDLVLAQDFGALGKALDDKVSHAIVLCAPHHSVEELRGVIATIVQRARLITGSRASHQPGDPWDDFLTRAADYYALLAELGFITEDPEKTHGDLPDDIVDAVRALELRGDYLSASLRGYQSFGARFALVQRKVIIGDEMGLGKTVEAIAVLAHLRAKGSQRSLVICPASVVTNWIREVTSKSRLPAHRLHGSDRGASASAWGRTGGVAVTTFDTLPWLRANVTDLADVCCVVVDEAHYIKNPDVQRTQNARALIDGCDRAVLLTGTPLENRIEEFRNLVTYLQPKLVVTADGLSPVKFRRQVAPAYLRRNQEDVLTELPDQVDVDEWLMFSAEDAAAYRAAVAAGNFMAMRQAAMLGGTKSRKLERLVEIVGEAEDNGRRVVVFSYFRDALDQVARALPGRVFGPLTGSVPASKRQAMIDEFSAAGRGAVLVAQIVAGGVGLNIQAASVVVICEPQLKPTTEWQAIARARRMGQLESVQVHRLLSEEGVDQRIRDILARKRELFEEFARESDTAKSAPEAYDVSEAELAREIIAEERERLFAQPG
jgi:hypothetical protein